MTHYKVVQYTTLPISLERKRAMDFDLARLSTALDTANRRLEAYVETQLPLGLTIVEVAILRALYDVDNQHASTLAKAVGRAPTSFTPILDRLADKGFIERTNDPHDRRAVFIGLTEKAKKEKTHILRPVHHAAFTQEEIAALINSLAIIERIKA